MSRRLKMIVAYDGKGFSGWQSQFHRNTIQDHIERAFERIGGKPVKEKKMIGSRISSTATARMPARIGRGTRIETGSSQGMAPAIRTQSRASRASRQASVCAGLEALEPLAPALVLVHDAARPFASEMVAARAVWRLKCSVVAMLTAGPSRSPKPWASSARRSFRSSPP